MFPITTISDVLMAIMVILVCLEENVPHVHATNKDLLRQFVIIELGNVVVKRELLAEIVRYANLVMS